MAVDNTKKSFAKMEFPLTIKRQDAVSLDGTETWKSMAEAEEYAKSNPTAYVGQEISVIVDGVAKRYLIQNEAGDLAPMGAEAVSVASDTEVTEMFNEVFESEA